MGVSTQHFSPFSFCEKVYASTDENSGPSSQTTREHIHKFSNSTYGSWNIFTACQQIASHMKQLPLFAVEGTQKVFGKFIEAMGNAGSALSIPAGIGNAMALTNSMPRAYSQTDIASNDPQRNAKIARSYKDALLDSINFSNNLSELGLFLHSNKVIELAPKLFSQFNVFFNLTFMLSEGDDLIAQGFKLKSFYAVPADQALLDKMPEKKNLAWVTAVHDASGVGLALLSIAGAAAPMTGLFLSTWISTKIFCHFYEKMRLS